MSAAAPSLPRGTADAVVRRLFPQPPPYAQDPVGFCRDVLRFEPWSKQREVLEAVESHTRTAVRSCPGTGKTAIAARAALWFLKSFTPSRVITTALTWEQVRRQLWREIHAAYRIADGYGGRLYETRLELPDGSLAIGLSTDTPERFHGHHEDNQLLIVDEASGVDEAIFDASTGYLTAEHARLLLLGNPTQISGTFYRAFHDDAEMWETVAISVFDTPAFTGEKVSAETLRALPTLEYVEDMRRLYGEDSPVWDVRVLGRFPRLADNTVCSLAGVEAAQVRLIEPTQEPVVLACDVASFGSDETVIATRRGPQVRIARTYVGRDTMETVGAILEEARALSVESRTPPEFMGIVVDDVGVGEGVTARLREVGEFPNVVGFKGSRASLTGRYPNRRSELWFAFAEALPGVDLDADKRLAADLLSPRYRLDSQGRRVVEAKADTKKRLGRSPDRADAVLLTFVSAPDTVGAAPLLARPRRFDVAQDAYRIRREM